MRYLLCNPLFYAGMVRHGAALYPGQHEPLIDRELWEKVRSTRKRRRVSRGSPKHPDRVYLLAGLAKCHLCKLRLIGQVSRDRRGTEYQYLRDVADRRGFDCPDGGRSVRTNDLDAQIGQMVSCLVLPGGWREQVLDLVNHQDHQAEVERERVRLTEKQRRLRQAWLEVEIDDETYRREQTETQTQLDALVMPDEPDIVAAGQFLETLQTIWDEATASERKQLLNTLLEAILWMWWASGWFAYSRGPIS